MHRRLAVPMLPLRVWVHCPRASNGLLPPRSYPVGYMRWYAWSDSGFVPPSSFRQSFQQLSVRSLRRKSPPLHLYPHFGCSWVSGCDGDVVAELAKGSRQNPGALLPNLRVRFAALLDESHSLMQDLPNYAAEPMGDCPNGRLIAQPWQQTPEYRLKVTAIFPDRSMSRLVQYPPPIFIAFRGAAAVVLFGAFLLPRTGSHPGGQLRRRGKRAGLRPHFRDHLLRRIHSQTGHFRQSDHCVLMRLHGLRDHAVELGDLPIDELQPLQLQPQHCAVHRFRSSCQSIDQLLLATLQPVVSPGRQLLGVGLALGQSPQHAKPAAAQQIADYNGQLDPHLLQQTLHLILQPHPVPCELRLLPRHAAPSTLLPIRNKAQDQLVRDQPPHQTFGVFEVVLAPTRGTVGQPLSPLQNHTPPQFQPYRPPVLRGRLHDRFFHTF